MDNPGPQPRILIVEASRMVRAMIVKNIRDQYEFREEADGEAAWQTLVLDQSIDLVICSLSLPVLSGDDLLVRVRESRLSRLNQMPMLMISGDNDEALERAKSHGASDFIVRNTLQAELLTRIGSLLKVSHARKQPFVVETNACDVEELGTKFNVKARSEDGEFVDSLVEGKVRVTDRFNSNNQVELHPREQVTHLNGRLILGRIPEHEGFLWREGLIAFRDASFGDLLDEFEKYYGVKIEVRRQDMPTNLFTGKIRISEGIDHALWVLQQSADFQYTRNELKDMIYIH